MDEKIEAVARALCILDGKDPDQSTRPPGGTPGFQRFVSGSTDAQPLWTNYKIEAERFVVAAEALGPLLSRPDIKRW